MSSSSGTPLVLGFETSCDETGVGIVRGTELLADAVATSVDEHARFGGVVPEVASRAHLEAMVPTVHRALETAGVKLSDIDAIAVTAGPGLAGALLVGVAAAKVNRRAGDQGEHKCLGDAPRLDQSLRFAKGVVKPQRKGRIDDAEDLDHPFA